MGGLANQNGRRGSGAECGLVCGGGNAEDGLEYAEAMRKVNPSMQCLTINIRERAGFFTFTRLTRSAQAVGWE